jgi:hypothetical protein
MQNPGAGRRGVLTEPPTTSLPGLTRQSIFSGKKMDARVKPAHDELGVSLQAKAS